MSSNTNKDGVKKIDDRHRNFSTLIYLDSAPENWKELLSDLHVPIFISPFHEHDVNPDGEPKKPHYHVLIMYEGKKSVNQVREDLSSTNCVGLETVQSLRGMARYLCHLDNPEKYQYPISDVISLSGADYNHIIGLASDKYKCIGEIIDYIETNDIEAYSDLMRLTKDLHYNWYIFLCDNCTYVITEYLKSRTWKKDRDADKASHEKLNAMHNMINDISKEKFFGV